MKATKYIKENLFSFYEEKIGLCNQIENVSHNLLSSLFTIGALSFSKRIKLIIDAVPGLFKKEEDEVPGTKLVTIKYLMD